jgi:hypothetical protein
VLLSYSSDAWKESNGKLRGAAFFCRVPLQRLDSWLN